MARIPRQIAGLGAEDLLTEAAFDAYVGPDRELLADPGRGLLALHDGATVGGKRFNTNALTPGATLDQLAETATLKLMTDTERAKLAGVASGATNNPAGTFGASLLATTTQEAAVALINDESNDPIVITLIGDSRIKGGNASVGTASLNTNVANTFVWDYYTGAWRNAMTLGLYPYDTVYGNNNIGRMLARIARIKTQRPIYIIEHGVTGSTIFSWLDPTASHGVGNVGAGNFGDFKTYAAAAFASTELVSLGKTEADYMIVALGANNGGATRADMKGYISNIVSQVRENIMPGYKSDLPVIWMGMQEKAINSSNHNATLREIMNTTRDFSVASLIGVSDVGDSVHEDSAGMGKAAESIWKAMHSTEISVPLAKKTSNQLIWGGAVADKGDTATNPWKPPCGFPDQIFQINTAALSAYLQVDLTQWDLDDSFTVCNNSSGGSVLYVTCLDGQSLGLPGKPGIYHIGANPAIAGIPVQAGESIIFYKDNNTRATVLRASGMIHNPHKRLYGDGSSTAIAQTGSTTLTAWAEAGGSHGLTYAAGEITVLIAGLYLVEFSVWANSASVGSIAVQLVHGTAATIAKFGNGNSGEAYAKSISGQITVPCASGDVLRIRAIDAIVNWDASAILSHWTVTRLTGLEVNPA